MADETNKEILEEIGENVTEGTQTEGTQTEGTTGSGYLTKPYLVRNLQTFWGKIKQYITSSISGFVKEDYVNEAINTAVDGKANQTDLDSLEATVDGKANQTDLDSLEATVDGKADSSTLTALETDLKEVLAKKVDSVDGKSLSTKDFTAEYEDKLKGIAERATAVIVDSDWIDDSENPVQSKFIRLELAKKVDKENLQDSSDLVRLGNITSYATDEGHIVLNFPNRLTHFKIYTPNSDRPIEKISLRNNSEVLFTTFQEENGSWAVTIENPEGKTETEDESGNSKTTWKITPGESFNFYVEDFVLDNSKYKSFILKAKRDDMGGSQVLLDIVKIFES